MGRAIHLTDWRDIMRTAFAVTALVAAITTPAYAQPANAGLFLSVADNIGTEINGFGPFTDEDLIRTNPAGSFAEAFFAIDGGDLDAFHILPNGNYIFSSLFNGTIGATTFDDADLVEYDPNTGTVVGNYLGIGLSSFTSSAPDISAATTDGDGNLYFSMLGVTNTMNHAGGSLTFTDGDIVRVDATTGVASVFVSEADIFDDGDGDVYGLHWNSDGSFLMSTNEDESVSGNTFLDGDVFTYFYSSDVSNLFFSEANFSDTANGHDIDAVFFNVPAPAGALALPLCALAAVRRKRF
ncbi:MAG: hypothetical protein Phyf2KO_24990 [Phycisphaerales bacterium]